MQKKLRPQKNNTLQRIVVSYPDQSQGLWISIREHTLDRGESFARHSVAHANHRYSRRAGAPGYGGWAKTNQLRGEHVRPLRLAVNVTREALVTDTEQLARSNALGSVALQLHATSCCPPPSPPSSRSSLISRNKPRKPCNQPQLPRHFHLRLISVNPLSFCSRDSLLPLHCQLSLSQFSEETAQFFNASLRTSLGLEKHDY